MYNKLFTKILDSSIWLEPTPTRIVWVTLLAAMDEDGFAAFASIPNLAHRAVLSLEDTTKAIETLESPDVHSSDPDHEGRRIERVPGGWIILNAQKYRLQFTRAIIKEQTRVRVAKHRAKSQEIKALSNCNAHVTPSVAISATKSEAKETSKSSKKRTKAQSRAWRELNAQSDHLKHDPITSDAPGVDGDTYRDMLHDMETGVVGRTVPPEEMKDVEF